MKNNVRASETDCESFDKNLDFDFDTKIGENLDIDKKIGITDLNLAPYPMTSTYPDGSYLTVGDNQLEIVVALVKNDASLIYKITGDTSATMDVLLENAVHIGTTGTFTLRVKE